jgi:hypothetical protein
LISFNKAGKGLLSTHFFEDSFKLFIISHENVKIFNKDNMYVRRDADYSKFEIKKEIELD